MKLLAIFLALNAATGSITPIITSYPSESIGKELILRDFYTKDHHKPRLEALHQDQWLEAPLCEKDRCELGFSTPRALGVCFKNETEIPHVSKAQDLIEQYYQTFRLFDDYQGRDKSEALEKKPLTILDSSNLAGTVAGLTFLKFLGLFFDN